LRRRLKQQLALLFLVLAALSSVTTGCGDSGPSGPNAKAIEEFEDLGLSREEAKEEVAASNREAMREVRKDEKRFEKELREEASAMNHASGPEPRPQSASGGFAGVHASNYEAAREVCSAFPKEQTARELGLSASADEFEIAEAYADEGYTDRFRQAGFEGCFDGLQKRQEE
jgi:hypothetical protein